MRFRSKMLILSPIWAVFSIQREKCADDADVDGVEETELNERE